MKVTVRTEEEIAELNLWPAGEYGFEIAAATDKISKIKPDGTGGNEMIELKVAIFNSEGNQRILFDYLMDTAQMAYKLRHAAEACGILAKYEAGNLLASDFHGKTGHAKVRIQKDKTGNYPDKNVISDYVTEPNTEFQAPGQAKVNGATADPFEDSIPFDRIRSLA